MKRTLLALALLVPAIASAVVRVDMQVAHNDTVATESYEFANAGESQVVTSQDCGAQVTMKLVSESPEAATFVVTVEQDDETKCESEVVLEYGNAHAFECAKADVKDSVTMTASQLSVVEA